MSERRSPTAIAIQWTAIAAALVALPHNRFSPLWLGLFATPGVSFLWLSLRASRFLGFAQRLGIAMTMVLGLSFAIYQTPDYPVPQAALTYLLLPPLAYASLRERPLDVLHSLFLGLCLLVISSILSTEGVSTWVVVIFVTASALTLQNEARRMAVTDRLRTAAPLHPLVRNTQGAAVALACLSATAGLHSLLSSLPTPGVEKRPPILGQTHIGLSTRFDLRSSGGTPIKVQGEHLVEVRGAPSNLYLRCSYFDVAGIDEWELDQSRLSTVFDGAHPYRRAKVRDAESRSLEILRFEEELGAIYAPPSTYRMDGEFRLRGSTDLEAWFEPAPSGTLAYRADYQDLRPLAYGRSALRMARSWTEVPPEIETRPEYQAMADWYAREVGDDPTSLAMAISKDLQRRSTYALETPGGGSRYAIHNFMFGNRRGYCMHFASALAILLRLNDVPCRIAVGLYGGRVAPHDSRLRIFGSQDAHAWVEIPLAGLGWVPFDPTPATTLRDAGARVPLPRGEEGDLLAETESDTHALDRILGAVHADLVWPWLALFTLLLLARPGARFARRNTESRSEVAAPQRRTARRLLLEILDALRRRGYVRLHGQSLERFALELSKAGTPLAIEPLSAAFAAYQDVRFGARPLDPSRLERLEAGLRAARGCDS